MSKFSPSSFHWDKSVFGSGTIKPGISCFEYDKLKNADGEAKVIRACEILNTLTPEQIEAVELYGRSCYEDGSEDNSSGC